MADILQMVGGAFTATVNWISGFANSQGGTVAGALHSVTPIIPMDVVFGSTIIIAIIGIIAWKLLSTSPFRYLLLIIIGAILFSLWSAPHQAVQPLQNVTTVMRLG